MEILNSRHTNVEWDYSPTSFGFHGKLEFNCNRVTSLLNKFQPPTWLEIYLFSLKSHETTPARHVATGVRHVSPGEIGDQKKLLLYYKRLFSVTVDMSWGRVLLCSAPRPITTQGLSHVVQFSQSEKRAWWRHSLHMTQLYINWKLLLKI